MTVRRTIMLAAVLGCTLASCGGDSDKAGAKAVAYAYSYAMANYDVAAAEAYATAETRNTTLRRAAYYVDQVGGDYIAADTPARIEITKVDLTSDTTAYAIYHKVTPLKDFCDTLQLRKREGQWQAHAMMRIVKIDTAAAQAAPPADGGNIRSAQDLIEKQKQNN